MDDVVSIRLAKSLDQNFILSSWLHCYRYSSPLTTRLSSAVFYAQHEKLLKRLLAKPETRLLLACLSEDEDVILGYLVFEARSPEPLVHFCYVKKPFRGEGIMRRLFEASEIDRQKPLAFTHYTFDFQNFFGNEAHLTFDPYLAK